MSSIYLSRLSPQQRDDLVLSLHVSQSGNCFICEQGIDLDLHKGSIDVDHVEPSSTGGKDDPSNFALTHASCNRSKQASHLRVARVLARFERIKSATEESTGHGPSLGDILVDFGGAKHSLNFKPDQGSMLFSYGEIGDPAIIGAPVHTDGLSGLKYFFANLPIEYLHHDDRINPRTIGGSLPRLVEEFHRGRPQLHVALAWIDCEEGPAQVRIFDGQHKATAQILLGARRQPVRVFVNPDPDLLITTNTNAGTTLRQVAFDKSVQRRLGRTLFNDRLERYRKERSLDPDDESMSEQEIVKYFKGESREVKRYAIDSVRAAITHSPENKLTPYIEFGGKSTEKPLSYSSIEKTFLSFFIHADVLETPLDYRAEEGLNPRTLEIEQVVRLMNIVADEVLIGQFDAEVGTARIENKVQKGEAPADDHLRAFRMCKEEVLAAWLRYVSQIVQMHFTMMGKPFDTSRSFEYQFPEALWDNLQNYVASIKRLPIWVNHDLSSTVFGGKPTGDFWQRIFESGQSPAGLQVMPTGINLMEMIKPST